MVFLGISIWEKSKIPFLHDYSKSVRGAGTGLSTLKPGAAVVESKERSASFLQTLPSLEHAEAHYWQNFYSIITDEMSQTWRICYFQWVLYVELETEVPKPLGMLNIANI